MAIRRFHLFEFHDQPWFPEFLRAALTEWLRVVAVKFELHKGIAPVLGRALRKAHMSQVVDLCSGASGPMVLVQRELEASGQPVTVKITDKFPNREALRKVTEASGGKIEAVFESVDATAVSPDIFGFRTLFNAFHHFPPETARRILGDSCKLGQPIGIFEMTERSVHKVAISFFASAISVLFLMPYMRPRRVSWWLCTYFVPIIPVIVGWDGLVSHLRAYTTEELLALTPGQNGKEYDWEAGQVTVPSGMLDITYLIGIPNRLPRP